MEADEGFVRDSIFVHDKSNGKLPNKVHFSEPMESAIGSNQTPDARSKSNKGRRRRTSSSGSKDEDEESPKTVHIAPSKLRKLAEKDRHVSRTGKGRGKPKKGGGGGKGTWGKITDGFEEDGRTCDTKDPNYDSADEDEDTYIVSPSTPQMSPLDFQKQAEVIFKEYFENDDKQEVIQALKELNIKNIKPEIIRTIVCLAMEKKPHYCELTSQLISYLCGSVINAREISSGFDLVLNGINDLTLDTPNALDIMSKFIARAVVDDCIPPAYVNNHHSATNQIALEALTQAKVLLNMPHSYAKLENVWATGGGQQPINTLIDKIDLLLKEFMSSGDKEEVVRCIQELAVPHFHHQIVYQTVLIIIENGTDMCIHYMIDLLEHLSAAGIITPTQFQHGFTRVFGDMTEIVLDVPHAYSTLNKIIDRSIKMELLPHSYAEDAPQRGRKRFVSEGDGGAIKPSE